MHTIERIPELAAQARENLAAAGYENVHVHVGDGTLGLPDEAPFTAIAVAAAAPEMPERSTTSSSRAEGSWSRSAAAGGSGWR